MIKIFQELHQLQLLNFHLNLCQKSFWLKLKSTKKVKSLIKYNLLLIFRKIFIKENYLKLNEILIKKIKERFKLVNQSRSLNQSKDFKISLDRSKVGNILGYANKNLHSS